jgi:cell division protein FtsA
MSNVIVLNPAAPRGLPRQEPFGVLDVGTTKMCCLIARRRDSDLQLLGAGYQLAEGLRGGEIVNAEAAEASILAVLHEAEQQAGTTLREVLLGISAGRPQSGYGTVEIELGGRAVTGSDLDQALARAEAEARTAGVEVLHAVPIEISLDGGQPLRDPRGMLGRELQVVVHLVRLAAAPLHNLVAAVERCHVQVGGVVPSSYAAGLACLSEDETTLGALVLDLGGGVTGVARFADGMLQEIHAVPLGGHHVTQDLAFGLSTGRSQAERLKTLYGSVLSRAGDARQQLEVPGVGDPDDPPAQIVPRARLTEIIRPRVEEIFQLVQARLADSKVPLAGRRLVLTGGGSELEGVIELAEEMFCMPARLGRARALSGELGIGDLTAATTAIGLLRWSGEDAGSTFRTRRGTPAIGARLARLGQWLRENF